MVVANPYRHWQAGKKGVVRLFSEKVVSLHFEHKH